MKLLVTLCLGFLFLIASCGPDAKKLEDQKKQAIADSVERHMADSLHMHKADSIRHYALNRLDEIINKYPADYLFFYNESSNKGYFSIETDPSSKNLPFAKLWLKIGHNGDLDFASVYWNWNRLYHTMIRANIGDKIITSNEVPLNDYSNIVEDGRIETVWYINNKDNGILDAIVSSKDNEKIIITLLGHEKYTFNLRKEDIIMLKTGYEFAGLLKYLQLDAEKLDKMYP